MEDEFLLSCPNCTSIESCCMKKKLMLAMTRKIIQWLQDNEAQLQDIDYADGSDHCDVKTTVYRRPDVAAAWWIAVVGALRDQAQQMRQWRGTMY